MEKCNSQWLQGDRQVMPCRQWDVREQGAWLAGGSTVCRAEFGAIAISSAQRFLHIQVQSEVSSPRRVELVCGLSAKPVLIKDGRGSIGSPGGCPVGLAPQPRGAGGSSLCCPLALSHPSRKQKSLDFS